MITQQWHAATTACHSYYGRPFVSKLVMTTLCKKWVTSRDNFDTLRDKLHSLVPRPSPAPVFDRLQYAKTEPAQFLHYYSKRSKTGAGEGLGTRLKLQTSRDNCIASRKAMQDN